MMQLPALTPEERACLQGALPDKALSALVERLRQRLVASLGASVSVSEESGGQTHAALNGNEPVIEIEPTLAAAWLAVRCGGKPGSGSLRVKDDALIDPLRLLIRRALAETVVNLGDAAWPQALRLQVRIGPQQGAVEIFWNSEEALPWARRTIRGMM